MRRSCRNTLPVLLLLALASVAALPTRAAEPCEACTECTKSVVETVRARGWLGLGLHLHDRDGGLEVAFVDPQGPATSAGVVRGERILTFQGVDVSAPTREQVRELLHGIRPGERVRLEIEGGGERRSVTLRAAQMPARAIAEAVGAHYLEALRQSERPDAARHDH
jgi:predicted metalloprotease with PDZ domain